MIARNAAGDAKGVIALTHRELNFLACLLVTTPFSESYQTSYLASWPLLYRGLTPISKNGSCTRRFSGGMPETAAKMAALPLRHRQSVIFLPGNMHRERRAPTRREPALQAKFLNFPHPQPAPGSGAKGKRRIVNATRYPPRPSSPISGADSLATGPRSRRIPWCLGP